MKSETVSRRVALVGLLAVLAFPRKANASGTARDAARRGRFRAIRIDVSALSAQNWEAADWLLEDLTTSLHEAFAARIATGDPSADVLLVRIHSIYLAPPVSTGHGRGGAGVRVVDAIEGSAAILTAHGDVVATYPLYGTVQTGLAVNDLGRHQARSRVASLAQSVAWWLPKQMGP
jgi:hypothetical protein